jgi:hypothetical protein
MRLFGEQTDNAMNDLLDIIRWNVRDPYRRVLIPKKQKDGTMRNVGKWELRPEGEGVLPLTDKDILVEHAVLCGFQASQRLAGVTERSPDFVVDVRMSRRHKGKKLAAGTSKGKTAGGNLLTTIR